MGYIIATSVPPELNLYSDDATSHHKGNNGRFNREELGPYEITSLIGKGGMASVYLARQNSPRRDLAIKIFETKYATDETFIARFDLEAQIIASLNHPHIPKLYHYDRQEDLLYMVLDYINGGSLADVLNGKNPLSIQLATRLLEHVSEALDYAHQQGIIHRDVKPANILLDKNTNAYLADFGIAKLLDRQVADLTQQDMQPGTARYMAPELLDG